MKYFAEANEVCLVDINNLIGKLKNVDGCSEKVLLSSDLFFAEKVTAIPVTDCKKCDNYVPRFQIRKRRGRCPTEHAEQQTDLMAKWERFDYDIGCYRHTGLMCSNCGTEWGDSPYIDNKLVFLFCPTCGAKMIEER